MGSVCLLFIRFSPTFLLFLLIQKENTYMHVHTRAHHPPQLTQWKPDPCVFLSKAELPYEFSNTQKGLRHFLSAGHHLSCHSLKFPYFHDPSKGLCKSFSLSSGWNWPAHPEAAAQKGEIQEGRVVHTHLQRGSTILISLGNQIKNHLTLCQL